MPQRLPHSEPAGNPTDSNKPGTALAQGLVGTMSGIGASFSTTLTGLVAGSFGRAAGFLSIAAVALVALLLLWLQMPETNPREAAGRH
jgi:sugar phosphate permease